MLKIYAIPVSLYCAKLRILLRHKNLAWEEVLPPGGYGSDTYKQLVPAGNLPALEHQGMLLSDSEAIAEYLNEVFPEPDMLSGDRVMRAKIRERSRFHDTRLEPAVRALFAHIPEAKRDQTHVRKQWELIQTRLEELVRQIPEDLSQLTLGDCGFPVTCCWIKELAKHFELDEIVPGPVEDYLETLGSHQAVSAELAEYRPRLINWLADQ